MDSTPDRAKRLEYAISICLLAILFLIAAGLFLKQSDFDIAELVAEAIRKLA